MSKTKGFSKVLALVIMLALVMGILPMGVMATSYTCNGVTVQFGDPNATATWPESAMTLTRRGTTNVWDANYTGSDSSDYYPSILSMYAYRSSNDYITLEASNDNVRFVTYNNTIPTEHTSIKYSTNQNSNLFIVKLTGAGNVIIKRTSDNLEYATICFSAPKSARADGTVPSAVCGYLPIGQFARSNSFGWGAIYTDGTNTYGSTKLAKFLIDPTNPNVGGYTATGVSLGMLGGYVQFELATALNEDATRPYGIDFIVYGNPFVGNPEAGSVKVYGKVGGTNGWYNLAGSRHYQSGTVKHMNVSYIRLDSPNTGLNSTFTTAGIYYSTNYASQTGSTVNAKIASASWSGIPGSSGTSPANKNWWPEKASSENYEQTWRMWKNTTGTSYDGHVDGSYGISWETSETVSTAQVITYKGVVQVPDSDDTDYYRFGYADVRNKGTHYGKAINPYATLPSDGEQSSADGTTNCGGDGFDLSWAVDQNGNPVQVTDVTKIRVYSSVLYNAGILGETSTEVCGLYIASGSTSETSLMPKIEVGNTDGTNKSEVSTTNGTITDVRYLGNGQKRVFVTPNENATGTTYIFINGTAVSSSDFTPTNAGAIVQIIVQNGDAAPYITWLRLKKN